MSIPLPLVNLTLAQAQPLGQLLDILLVPYLQSLVLVQVHLVLRLKCSLVLFFKHLLLSLVLPDPFRSLALRLDRLLFLTELGFCFVSYDVMIQLQELSGHAMYSL